MRIASLINFLLQEGKVTQDPTWEKNWVGAVAVRKLTTAIITDALQYGTLTWDISLAKVLSIVWVAALGVRTGDVNATPRDHQKLPYLCYHDITIKMDQGTSIDDLLAVVVIRNQKGDK